MGRIKPGSIVPSLEGTSFSNGDINIEQFRGAPLILSFYRYAACPFCNLRMHHFIKNYISTYQPIGINAIAVFQSPISSIGSYLEQSDAPFDIIADPKQVWYKKMGLKTSWLGLMAGSMNIKQGVEATQKGLIKINPEGPINRLPADFLISPEGVVEKVYYGKNISDHIPFDTIENWTKQYVTV